MELKVKTSDGNLLNWSRRKSEVIHNTVKLVGLSEKIDEPIRRLSGGQQRRVAGSTESELILADEFLSELDKENSDSIILLMKKNMSKILSVECYWLNTILNEQFRLQTELSI